MSYNEPAWLEVAVNGPWSRQRQPGIPVTADEIVSLIASATGDDFTVQDFRRCGERFYNLIRLGCVREGLRREDDILPGRLMEDALPDGPAEGMRIDRETLEKMKDAYYEMRGWDLRTGIPTRERLKMLGIEEMALGL